MGLPRSSVVGCGYRIPPRTVREKKMVPAHFPLLFSGTPQQYLLEKHTGVPNHPGGLYTLRIVKTTFSSSSQHDLQASLQEIRPRFRKPPAATCDYLLLPMNRYDYSEASSMQSWMPSQIHLKSDVVFPKDLSEKLCCELYRGLYDHH